MASSTILERIHALLETAPPFDQLSEEERRGVVSDLSVEYFEPEEVIVEQGKTMQRGLFIVEAGLVILMDVQQQQLIAKCGEGSVFGSFVMLKGGSTVYEAKAVEPTVCALLRPTRFHELYDQNKDFAAYFDRDLELYFRHLGRAVDVSGRHLLLGQQLEQFVHRPPVTCRPDLTAREAAQYMNEHRVSSLLVMHRGRIAGILTDRDLRARFVAQGLSADTPVRDLMSSPVVTIPVRASLFEAITHMLEHRVRRLVITKHRDKKEVPVGLLTHRDVAHFRGLDPVATMRSIESRSSVSDLTDVRAEISEHLLRLYRQGVEPEGLGRLAAVIYDRIVVYILRLVEQELQAASAVPCVELPWVWLRLGSSGRQEMALNSAQHNAVLYANPSSQEEQSSAEQWFNLLAERVNKALEACGFTPSTIVARDPHWRMPLSRWRQAYGTWIYEADEAALATAPIFFDVRGIYGDLSLVEKLKQDIGDALNIQMLDQERRFLPLLAQRALQRRPPLSLFRRFEVERKGDQSRRFDIRERGILPVVDAARVLALETRFFDSMNTFDRLRYAAEVVPESADRVKDVLYAYQHLVDFRLEHQLSQVEAGGLPDNYIAPALLTKMQRDLLRSAFKAVEALQEALADRYGVPLG